MSRCYRNRDLGLAQLGERALELGVELELEQPAARDLTPLGRSIGCGLSRSARIGRRLLGGTASPRDLALAAELNRLEPDHAIKSYLRSFDEPTPRRRRRAPCDDEEW